MSAAEPTTSTPMSAAVTGWPMKIFAGLLALSPWPPAGSCRAGVAAVGNTDPASAV